MPLRLLNIAPGEAAERPQFFAMNEPESLNEILEEVPPNASNRDVEDAREEAVVDGRLLPLNDDYHFLLNLDEDDEPRLQATGEMELPSPEDCLDAYQAVLLYNYLCSNANAPQLTFKPTDKQRPQLYDWFVSSLNVCPLTQVLDQLLKRLVAWKKQTGVLRGADEEDDLSKDEINSLNGLGVEDSIDWGQFPGIRI